jgi:hypothetical protein
VFIRNGIIVGTHIDIFVEESNDLTPAREDVSLPTRILLVVLSDFVPVFEASECFKVLQLQLFVSMVSKLAGRVFL